jgi:hypothetical protein
VKLGETFAVDAGGRCAQAGQQLTPDQRPCGDRGKDGRSISMLLFRNANIVPGEEGGGEEYRDGKTLVPVPGEVKLKLSLCLITAGA